MLRNPDPRDTERPKLDPNDTIPCAPPTLVFDHVVEDGVDSGRIIDLTDEALDD